MPVSRRRPIITAGRKMRQYWREPIQDLARGERERGRGTKQRERGIGQGRRGEREKEEAEEEADEMEMRKEVSASSTGQNDRTDATRRARNEGETTEDGLLTSNSHPMC